MYRTIKSAEKKFLFLFERNEKVWIISGFQWCKSAVFNVHEAKWTRTNRSAHGLQWVMNKCEKCLFLAKWIVLLWIFKVMQIFRYRTKNARVNDPTRAQRWAHTNNHTKYRKCTCRNQLQASGLNNDLLAHPKPMGKRYHWIFEWIKNLPNESHQFSTAT